MALVAESKEPALATPESSEPFGIPRNHFGKIHTVLSKIRCHLMIGGNKETGHGSQKLFLHNSFYFYIFSELEKSSKCPYT